VSDQKDQETKYALVGQTEENQIKGR